VTVLCTCLPTISAATPIMLALLNFDQRQDAAAAVHVQAVKEDLTGQNAVAESNST
jgi:hypothetical protein